MKSFPIKSGVLIPILLMLPNIVWMLARKADTVEATNKEPLVLTIIENIGRIAILLLPIFYSLHFQGKYSPYVVGGMLLSLGIYYFCWGKYFMGGMEADLLRSSFLGIPLPMAVMPVLFMMLSSYLLQSWWMLVASIFFGIAHIWVSAISL